MATEWTSQAVRGSAAAFAGVYERHHRALYRYCRALLGDDEEAHDALQSTMTKAFAALRFEERDFELRPWLFRIAHNEAVSRLRQRRDAVELDLVATLTTDSLAQTVEDRERLAQLRADLRELPERQRAALVMRELSGLGHAEIAAVLGGSAATVKQTIFAARAALHECAEGRAMLCAEVQDALSGGDGRVLRSRRMRAHVRACRACREFQAGLAVAPAPPAVACATWLSRLLAMGGGSSAGAVATKVAAVVVAAASVAGATTAVSEVTRGASDLHPVLARAPTVTATPVRAPERRERAGSQRAISGHAAGHSVSAAIGPAPTTVAVKPPNAGGMSAPPGPSEAGVAKPALDDAPGRGASASPPRGDERSAAASKRVAHGSRVRARAVAGEKPRRAGSPARVKSGEAPRHLGGAVKPDPPASRGRGTPPPSSASTPPAAAADVKAQAPAASTPADAAHAHNEK